jgi:hypothetical protein
MMNTTDGVMSSFHDHIMANTWRLIFERQLPLAQKNRRVRAAPDFTILEQILPEYRLIGLSLADRAKEDRPS